MEFPDTSMQLQLHESKTGSLTRLSPNCTKPIMPRHSMTLSRRQNKHLKTPATLETSGSTSAVPSHRLSAWKATCANPWMHRHGAACGKRFASRPSTQIMLLEMHQKALTTHSAPILPLLSQARWELPATCAKNSRLGLHTRSQKLMSKMKQFLASPQ